MNNFDLELEKRVGETVSLIMPFLSKEEGYPKRVIEAMNYSFLAGGKRLRPMLMMESFRLFGGEDLESIAPFMCALEMIHTYSLVHDDLPAMDDDDLRRGRPTTHKAFDEACAILAGDALLNRAFELVTVEVMKEEDINLLRRKAHATYILSCKAGIEGMIGGQTADIEAEKKDTVAREELLYIHENKTAALIEAALMVGAIIAGANPDEIVAMERIGRCVGVAFQIQDDILDQIGDEAVLGKPIGSDAKNEKITYVTLEGLEKAMQDQRDLSKEAIELLDRLPGNNPFLKNLILSLVERKK